MAFHKTSPFNDWIRLHSALSKSISHPARLRILQLICENGSSSFDFIQKHIPLSIGTVSYHLKALRNVDLLQVQEEVPHTYYSLSKSGCKYLIYSQQKLAQMLDSANPLERETIGK